MDKNHQEPPKTSREIGIHLVYMSKSIEELKVTVENLTNNFATKQELLEAIKTRQLEQKQIVEDINSVCNRVNDVEKIINAIKNKIVGVAVTMLVLMVLAQWGLAEFFKR